MVETHYGKAVASGSRPIQDNVTVGQPAFADMFLSQGFPPNGPVKIRKKCITTELCINFGEVKPVRAGQRFTVKPCSADHKDFWITPACSNGLLQGNSHHRPLCRKTGATAHDHRGSPRQETAERFEGLAPRDDMMPHGQGAEALEILRQMPRQSVINANDIVLCKSSNNRNSRHIYYYTWV
jgi:hypothetical protein